MKKLAAALIAIGLSGCVAYPVEPGHQYHGNHQGYRDRDRDGVANRADRDRDGDGVRNRYDRDRDGDGVRNRYDRRPNDPRRH